MDVVQPDVEVPRSHRSRRILGVLLAAAVVVAAITIGRPGPPAENTIRIGRIQDFPLRSAIALTLNAAFFNPNPRYSPTPGGSALVVGPIGRQSPLRVWVVNDQRDGLLVLLSRDPQSGCRIKRPDQKQDSFFARQIEDFHGFFIDPCHGDVFSYTGEWLTGPGNRGLDRFAVTIAEDGSAIVHLKELHSGPARR